MFFDSQGRLRSLLAAWTDVEESDLFSRCSAGQSRLRVDDLVHLRALIDELGEARGRGDGVK